jgi:hypothetical protein
VLPLGALRVHLTGERARVVVGPHSGVEDALRLPQLDPRPLPAAFVAKARAIARDTVDRARKACGLG